MLIRRAGATNILVRRLVRHARMLVEQLKGAAPYGSTSFTHLIFRRVALVTVILICSYS